MTGNDRQLLLRIVWDRLSSGKLYGKQRHVERDIRAAHDGRPDGLFVTPSNMWLFRQYRNDVSPDATQLVHEAMDFYREENQ